MEKSQRFDAISVEALELVLKDYPDVVPTKLVELEHERLEVIPKKLQTRVPPLLMKDELVKLMNWKLAHGKFRPALKGLIQRNSDVDVQKATQEAFSMYLETLSKHVDKIDVTKLKKPITKLSTLSGVGPATASLLLAELDPMNVPFYSDELFRWIFCENDARDDAYAWKRKIKYDAHEYLDMTLKVRELQARLARESGKKVAAVDIEKVAYVLGKRATGRDGSAALEKADARVDVVKAAANEVSEPATTDEAAQNEQTGSVGRRTTRSASKRGSAALTSTPPAAKRRKPTEA